MSPTPVIDDNKDFGMSGPMTYVFAVIPLLLLFPLWRKIYAAHLCEGED